MKRRQKKRLSEMRKIVLAEEGFTADEIAAVEEMVATVPVTQVSPEPKGSDRNN